MVEEQPSEQADEGRYHQRSGSVARLEQQVDPGSHHHGSEHDGDAQVTAA